MKKTSMLLLSLFAVVGVAQAQAQAQAQGPAPLWVAKGFSQPAGALYAPDDKSIYVSNSVGDPAAKDGKGFISKLSADGKLVKLDWVTGLNAPKGMAYAQGHLFVADVDAVVVIDARSGRVLKRYDAPGAQLVDISLEYHSQYKNQVARGNVSDKIGNAFWYLGDGGLSKTITDASLENPTGVLMEKDDLRFTSSGPKGRIKNVPQDADSAVDRFGGAAIGDLASIEPDGKGGYWVDEGASGKIWRVSSGGAASLWLTVGAGAGDLGQIPGKALLVPIASGEVRAYVLPK